MVRPYASFVLRCWDLGGEQPRVKVEHVQSGESARVASLAAALDWIGARSRSVPADETAGSRSASSGGVEVMVEE